jgi:hypothetical protein
MELIFLLIPVIIVLVIVAAYYSYVQQRKRREALALLADQLGWQFDPSSDYGHDNTYGHFSMFRQGHSRRAYNSINGVLEIEGASWPIKMGDYEYKVTTSNGKTTTTHTYHFSYLILHTPFTTAPDLLIRREGIFDAMKSLFGFDDIDFESAEFSRRFCVKSSDKRFAYDVIHTGMMEFLMREGTPTIEFRYGQCLLTTGTRTWPAEKFRAMIDWSRQFFELWPQHVVAQLEHQKSGI